MLFVMLLFGAVFISGTDIERIKEFINDESDKF